MEWRHMAQKKRAANHECRGDYCVIKRKTLLTGLRLMRPARWNAASGVCTKCLHSWMERWFTSFF